MAAYSYTWDQNESNHRALNSLHDSMYMLQLHMGVPHDVAHQVMTPEAFQTHVSWPGVRPFYLEGVNADVAEASEKYDE